MTTYEEFVSRIGHDPHMSIAGFIKEVSDFMDAAEDKQDALAGALWAIDCFRAGIYNNG